jgi:hypothetical protein
MSEITVEITQAIYSLVETRPEYSVAITRPSYTVDYVSEIQFVDYEGYYTEEEVNALLDAKQDTLISATNIKTINNTSILGSGNIVVEGGEGGGITAEKIRVVNSMPITFAEGDICFNASDNGLYIGVD